MKKPHIKLSSLSSPSETVYCCVQAYTLASGYGPTPKDAYDKFKSHLERLRRRDDFARHDGITRDIMRAIVNT